jgi:hypothetical protein
MMAGEFSPLQVLGAAASGAASGLFARRDGGSAFSISPRAAAAAAAAAAVAAAAAAAAAATAAAALAAAAEMADSADGGVVYV